MDSESFMGIVLMLGGPVPLLVNHSLVVNTLCTVVSTPDNVRLMEKSDQSFGASTSTCWEAPFQPRVWVGTISFPKRILIHMVTTRHKRLIVVKLRR